MTTDPIAAEVRAARDRLAARFGYDLEAIFRHVQAEEARSGLTYVPCPPRRPAPAAGGGPPLAPLRHPREAAGHLEIGSAVVARISTRMAVYASSQRKEKINRTSNDAMAKSRDCRAEGKGQEISATQLPRDEREDRERQDQQAVWTTVRQRLSPLPGRSRPWRRSGVRCSASPGGGSEQGSAP